MSQESRDQRDPRERYFAGESWASWGSPVGLSLFFVLMAVAADLVRFAFK